MNSVNDCKIVIDYIDSLLPKELSNIVYDYYRYNLEDAEFIDDKQMEYLQNDIFIITGERHYSSRMGVVPLNKNTCCVTKFRRTFGDVIIKIRECEKIISKIKTFETMYFISREVKLFRCEPFIYKDFRFNYIAIKEAKKLNNLLRICLNNNQLMKEAKFVR